MSKQQQEQFDSFKLVNLFFFFGRMVLKDRTEKPHRGQVTISLTFESNVVIFVKLH